MVGPNKYKVEKNALKWQCRIFIVFHLGCAGVICLKKSKHNVADLEEERMNISKLPTLRHKALIDIKT